MKKIISTVTLLTCLSSSHAFAVSSDSAISACSLSADAYITAVKIFAGTSDAATVSTVIQQIYGIKDTDLTAAVTAASKDAQNGGDREKYFSNCVASRSGSN